MKLDRVDNQILAALQRDGRLSNRELADLVHLSESHAHEHVHEAQEHEHAHEHDDGHHAHPHDSMPIGPHSHSHRHEPVRHAHPHVPDAHHGHRH